MNDDRPDDSIRWHAEVGAQEEYEAMKYTELRNLDVSKYVEKKGITVRTVCCTGGNCTTFCN